MKNLFKLPVLVLGLLFLLAGSTQKAVAQDDDVSLQTFYDELSPYGVWIQDPEYGYVWRPDVDQEEFRPYYTNGRWVMTEYGNTWVSDYDWGWAPFHYGRWILNRYSNWIWIPDTTWGPAWVSWRSGGGYYGWAPLAPGINININFGGGYHTPNSWWVFVPQRNIYYDRFPRYRGHRNVNIFNHTTIINYTGQRNRHTYYTGPRRDDIRRATNRDVRVYNVNRTDRSRRSSISDNTVNIYNPRTSRNTDNSKAAPRKVSSENAYTGSRSDRNNNSATTRANTNRNDAATRSNDARTRTTERNNAPGATVDRAESRTSREAPTATRQRTDAADRAERVQRQGQDQANREQQSENQQRAQAQQRERAQQQTQERAQSQELNRQQQAREQSSRQQQERVQQERTQSAPRQQAQPQQRQREQQSAPRQQVQQPRQERVQQSAPSRSNENRSRAQSQSSGRASRGDRG
jgi:DNA segregation ATPase FtsK/SpoIIIE-like protein